MSKLITFIDTPGDPDDEPVKKTSENESGALFVKGGAPGPGRPKGTPNRSTSALRDLVWEALHRAGGIEWLTNLAINEPSVFAGLLGRLLPRPSVDFFDDDPLALAPVVFAEVPESNTEYWSNVEKMRAMIQN